MADIFISYSQTDREFVDRLARDLEKAGLSVFSDKNLAAGEPWLATLEKAIKEAHYILVVLSPEAVSSDWIRAEIVFGLGDEAAGHSRLIPLMLRDCDPPMMLRSKVWADFRSDYMAGLSQLLPALTQPPSSPLTEDMPGAAANGADPVELERERVESRHAAALLAATPQKLKTSDRPSTSGKRKCFIVMPFGDEALQVVYEDFVRPVIEMQCELCCERGDDVFGSNVVMDDIRNSISASDIVVADLTGKNANVFYEVGICHTLDKPVLLMTQSIEDVPFDLRHRRVLLYEYSPRGCKKLEKTLEQNLRAMLRVVDGKTGK